jgi:hypothetical protein
VILYASGEVTVEQEAAMDRMPTRSERIYAITSAEYQRFVRGVHRGLDKPLKRFVREMLWGIVMSESVKLSRIGQWIIDGTHRLLYRVKRLSRRMRQEWPHETVTENHLHAVSQLIDDQTSIVIDTSDLRKNRGHAFQYLDRVRDGSRHETAPGFWFLTVTAVFGAGRQLPLYMAPYSAKHPAFESENSEVERAVQIITHGIGTKGVWVADRGFDNRWFFNTMERFGLRFLVCAYHARTVLWHGQECSLSDVVNEVSLPYRMPLVRRRMVDGIMRKQHLDLRYGAVAIALPEEWNSQRQQCTSLVLWVLVVQGYDPSGARTFFLTNVPLPDEPAARAMVHRYRDRWAVEEAIQFMKQRFHLEDVRVRSWSGLQAMLDCAMLACAFLARYVERMQHFHKRVISALCAQDNDLDPDAKFLLYRVHTALVLACAISLTMRGL